jgi:hypothetical protein
MPTRGYILDICTTKGLNMVLLLKKMCNFARKFKNEYD